MSQPDSNAPVHAGQSFFRLQQALASDGDIFESEQGANGLSIGPDSDLSRVIVSYFDDTQAQDMNRVALTPERPFPGQIPARNDVQYPNSARPGRMFIWPDHLFDPEFTPNTFAPLADRLDVIAPVIDVVEYFAPGQLPAGRNDKEYLYQRFPWVGAGKWWLVLPWYGRRFASVTFSNFTDVSVSIGISGVDYTLDFVGVETEIVAPAAVAAGTVYSKVVKASEFGVHDALMFSFTPAAAPATQTVKLKITTSDRES